MPRPHDQTRAGPGSGSSPDLSAVTAEAVERSRGLPARVWGFGVGGFFAALVRAGRLRDDPTLVTEVHDRLAGSLHAAADPTDHLIAVEALMALREALPGLDIADACERWATAVVQAPRRTVGGPRVHRPDLAPWQDTIWVDCMHTDGPGLARLGYREEAVRYASEYAAVLQRDDGLFHHGYDVDTDRGNGVAWGRGQCWALLGLLHTWEQVPDDTLRERFNRLLSALAEQERDGRWHTVVDDAQSPIEGSVGAYVAWAVPQAIEAGLASRQYHGVADRAFAAMLADLDHGQLVCSGATPVGDAESYHGQPTGVFPWGQAPLLHSLLDRLSEDGHEQ